MRSRLVAGGSLTLLVVLALGVDDSQRTAVPPGSGRSWSGGVRLYPLPRRVVDTCRAAQARARITILCPARLPRPVRDEVGASAPPLDPISAFDFGDGVDISYSAETGRPGSTDPGASSTCR